MTDHDDETADEPDLSEVRPGERIAKTIARAGLGSRREAEAWIAAGRVAVNGAVIDTPAVNVTRADKVTVDGKALPERERTRLWLFHKPRGLVTTNHDPDGRPTIFGALPPELPRVMTVGRLDINTEGLLLLTNDGGLARVLELPSTGWLRKYRVRAHGEVKEADLERLREGMAVDGILYGPIEASLDQASGHNAWLTLGLREGKNREIKNVLGALGLEVSRLIRVSFGPFQLGGLARGAVEEVKTRMLKDQLGPRLAEAAGADFSGPAILPPPPTPRAARATPAVGPSRGGDRQSARAPDRGARKDGWGSRGGDRQSAGSPARGARKDGWGSGGGDRPRGKPPGADRGPRRDTAEGPAKPRRLLFDVAEDGVGHSETWVPGGADRTAPAGGPRRPGGAGKAAAVGRDDRARIRPSTARGDRPGRPPADGGEDAGRPPADRHGPSRAAGGRGRPFSDRGERTDRPARDRREGGGRGFTGRDGSPDRDRGGASARPLEGRGEREARPSTRRGEGPGRPPSDRDRRPGGGAGERGGRSARSSPDRSDRGPRRETGSERPRRHGDDASPPSRKPRSAGPPSDRPRNPRPAAKADAKGDRPARPAAGRGPGRGGPPKTGAKGRRPGGAAPRSRPPGGGRKDGR